MSTRIIHLIAQNVKGLKAIDLTPPRHQVEITGANGAGKTSVLDSIMYALGGKDSIPDHPIRTGARRAEIKLETEDFTVLRTFTDPDDRSKGALKITPRQGILNISPQKFLDSILGRLSFDPLGFSRLKAAQQFDELVKLVDIGIDLDRWKTDRQTLFAERTSANREVKKLAAQLDGLDPPTPNLPEQEIDLLKITQRIEIANTQIAEYSKERNRLQNLRDTEARLCKELLELERQIELKRAEIEQIGVEEHALALQVEQLQDPDLLTLEQQLSAATQTNRQIHAASNYRRVETALKTEEQAAADLNTKLEALDAQRAAALVKAVFPIPGLSLGEDCVLYQGLPFEQLSSSEQLRISTAIAMAANPDLRLILIRDGSLLDSKSLEIIHDLATTHDYQVWCERVDESGKIGIVIEAGEVKANNYESVTA